MTWQAIVMYAVVVGLGIPAAFRNPTALAMVIAWLCVEFVYQLTGNPLPLQFSFMADVTVIAAIYAKTTNRSGAKHYSSLGEQTRCMITDLTPCDRWVLAIFLVMWPLYVLLIDPWWKWHLLWGLAITQFLFASAEAFKSFRRDLKSRADPPSSGLALAGANRWSMPTR